MLTINEMIKEEFGMDIPVLSAEQHEVLQELVNTTREVNVYTLASMLGLKLAGNNHHLVGKIISSPILVNSTGLIFVAHFLALVDRFKNADDLVKELGSNSLHRVTIAYKKEAKSLLFDPLARGIRDWYECNKSSFAENQESARYTNFVAATIVGSINYLINAR